MKAIALVLSLLLLTSCSNPDTSGGVTLSRGGGGDWDNNFPYGSCKGPDYFDNHGTKTGCGWVHSDEGSHYIMPGADLSYAHLRGANLSGANLSGKNLQYAYLRGADLTDADLSGADLQYAFLRDADLTDAELSGIKANSFTTCPDGMRWGTAGNNCPF